MQRQPKVDEMVEFLDKTNPGLLEKLRLELPTYQHILKPGEILGPSTDNEELKARARICFESTNTVLSKADDKLNGLKLKIGSTQKIQLWGQIITTISGATVITALAASYNSVTYFSGALGLLGSLIPLIIDQRSKSLNNKTDIGELYVDLVKLKLEAQRNAQELQFFIDNNFNVSGINEVINRCNLLCSEIMEKHYFS